MVQDKDPGISNAPELQNSGTTKRLLDPAPIDTRRKPIRKEDVLDIHFETQGGLKVATIKGLDHMVYLYEGDTQVARARLTADDQQIETFHVQLSPREVRKVLITNPAFPFREQLLKSLQDEPDRKFEFTPSTDVIARFEQRVNSTFNSVGLVFVPKSFLVWVLEGDTTADALHINNYNKKGNKLDLNRPYNRALSWFLENQIPFNQAMEYATTCINPRNISIAIEQKSTVEEYRLTYHEVVHETFRAAERGSKEEREIVESMGNAYLAIPIQDRLNFEDLLSPGYSSREFPEEFWAYCLSTLTFPTTSKETKEGSAENIILELSESPSVQTVIEYMPFLTDEKTVRQKIDDLIDKAKRVP